MLQPVYSSYESKYLNNYLKPEEMFSCHQFDHSAFHSTTCTYVHVNNIIFVFVGYFAFSVTYIFCVPLEHFV